MGLHTRYVPPHYLYIDPTDGNDARSGTSKAGAIKTLAVHNAMVLRPGTEVLLRRGQTAKAQILVCPSSGLATRQTIYAWYGTGANPILDPTTRLTDFEVHDGAIWSRSDVNNVNQVFEDGVRMTYAAAHAGLAAGAFAKEAGAPGTLYIRCSDGGNPNTEHTIDVGIPANDIAIQINGKSHLVFDSIDVTKANVAAYNTGVAGTANVTIKNCTVNWCGVRSMVIGTDTGLTYTYPVDVTIKNCVGHDDLDLSFWLGHGTNLIVDGCETYNSGKDLSPRAKNYPSATHWPNGILVSGEGIGCIVRRNYVHDIYNTCIYDELSLGLTSTGTLIEGNHIVDNQGGALTAAIRIVGNGTIVRNNWIEETLGFGLYTSDSSPAPQLLNNTIVSASGAAHSIYCATGVNPVIKNNLVIRAGGTNRYVSIPAAVLAATINNNGYYGASTQRWFRGATAEHVSFAAWQGNPIGPDAAGINADPTFVSDYTDLQLQAGSPAIGAGANLGHDHAYNLITRPNPPSIGAFEAA